MSFILSLLGGAATAVVGGMVMGPTLIVVAVLGWIAATLSGLLLSLGGLITSAANNLQIYIPTSDFVVTGWTIVRDIANLGFVIVIIIIAFATILRLENYNAKKLLPRLIGAAILVNFSLQIGAFIIGFSQVITDFFFTKVSLGVGDSVGSVLLGAFNPQRFMAGIGDPVTAGVGATIGIVVGPWLTTIFNLIMLFTILVLGFMLIIRFFYLSFLLVIAPITWLFWVIPELSGQFSKWWSKFFQWVFFAPAVSFFVYLSFTASQTLGQLTKTGGEDGIIAGVETLIKNIFMSGVEVILLSGFLIGGIMVAQHMSIIGAAGAMGLVQKTEKGARAWAGRQTKQVGARALESKWMGMPALAGAMQRIPGLKRAGMALGGRADIMRRELVEDADQRLKKYSDAHLAKNLDTLSAPEKVATKERLAKNDTVGLIKDRNGNGNVLNNVTAEERKLFESYYGKESRQWKAFEVAAGMNVAAADALRARDTDPRWKEKLTDGMVAWIKKLSPDQISKLPATDIFNGELDLAKIGLRKGDQEAAEAFRGAVVNGIAQNIPSDIAKLFSKVKGEGFEQLHSTTTLVRGDIMAAGDKERAAKILNVLANIASLRLFSTTVGGTTPTTPPPAAPPPTPPPPPKP